MSEILLDIQHLSHVFKLSKHIAIKAVDDVSFQIKKADYDMSDVRWDYTEAFQYDGLQKTLSLVGLPAGLSASAYEGKAPPRPAI